MPLVVGNRCSSNRAPHLPQRPYGLFSRWSFPPEPTIFHDARRVSGASLFGVGEDGLPTLFFRSPAEWEEWLEKNHALSEGIWIKIAKKDAEIESVRYPEVLESALCFGWIDARREALDGHHFLQRFTPRRRRSKWSRINRDTAERLIAHGRMRPAGVTEVERANADGRWEAAYTGQMQSAVPDDLQRELGTAQGKGVLRRAEQPEPLRDPLPTPGRQAARDASASAREVRRDARGRRDDSPLGADARSDRADAQAVSHVHPSHARARARLAEPASTVRSLFAR